MVGFKGDPWLPSSNGQSFDAFDGYGIFDHYYVFPNYKLEFLMYLSLTFLLLPPSADLEGVNDIITAATLQQFYS